MRLLALSLCLLLTIGMTCSGAMAADKNSGNSHPWQLSKEDYEHAKDARSWANRNRWDEAIAHAKRAKDPLIKNIFLWMKYVNGGGKPNFKEFNVFMHDHPEWPDQNLLMRRAEEMMNYQTPSSEVLDWFEDTSLTRGYREPITAKGKQLLGEALLSSGKKDEEIIEDAHRLIRDSWVEGNYSASEQKEFVKRHGPILQKEDHLQRTNRLLLDSRVTEARRMLSLVDREHQKLYEARIALITNAGGIDSMIKNLPNKFENDPGLVYDRARWRASKKRYDSLKEFLQDYISSTKDFGEKWWKLKIRAFWDQMDDKRYEDAYIIISHHGMDEGSQFAEGEWLSGWVALRYLNDPHKAYKHFYKLFQGVSTPISLSRAAYWSGRAAEANKNLKIARGWYEVAKKYPNTFYGQLAILKLGTREISIPPQPEPTKDDFERYLKNDVARAAYILHNLKDYRTAKKFIKAATIQAKTIGEAILVTRMGAEMKHPEYGVAAAKEMSKSGMIVMESNYPIPPFEHPTTKKPITRPEPAMVYAITLQESQFDIDAKSPAGAMGLMQLMPHTARTAARREHLRYSRQRLTADGDYNVALGSHYLDEMVDGFNGSYILGIASYNAGPTNVKKWIKQNGDPRELKSTDQIIDWIERIPFSETRNYVMRVLENVQMFRYQLDSKSELSLDKDLQRHK